MILGLTLSHDASAAVLDKNGVVIFAISEERLSRKKNHVGIPVLAITHLMSSLPQVSQLQKVVIGSHSLMDHDLAVRMVVSTMQNPSNPASTIHQPFPGFVSKNLVGTGHEIIEKFIASLLDKVCDVRGVEFVWVNHHDSHLGCALGASEKSKALLFSFDGSGDGESAAVAMFASRKSHYTTLARVPAADSLGNLYSAVTKRYNFKVSQHEGKITGLAAYGSFSGAYDVLKSHIEVKDGVPEILYIKQLKKRLSVRALRQMGLCKKSVISLDEIAQLASSKTVNYPDLAFAVQRVLEESILEVVNFWISKTEIFDVSLAGGVFANVKLNQRISDLEVVETVNIFPNMGDGGISVGGVWSHLLSLGELSDLPLYQNMYLSPPESEDSTSLPEYLDVLEWTEDATHAVQIAKDISDGKLVAVHQGSMEFGPRALGNRSLILDARNREIIDRTNRRLNRTEFMPFAPIVLEEDFSDYFETSNRSFQPFEYMTMTCDVLEGVRKTVPAVTHIDGTARPQIVSKISNPFLYQILSAYKELTRCSVLVNTSLNMHEEPINNSLSDSIRALKLGGVDVIHTRLKSISLKS